MWLLQYVQGWNTVKEHESLPFVHHVITQHTHCILSLCTHLTVLKSMIMMPASCCQQLLLMWKYDYREVNELPAAKTL